MGVDEYVSECESECNFSSILFVSSSCFTFYLFFVNAYYLGTMFVHFNLCLHALYCAMVLYCIRLYDFLYLLFKVFVIVFMYRGPSWKAVLVH